VLNTQVAFTPVQLQAEDDTFNHAGSNASNVTTNEIASMLVPASVDVGNQAASNTNSANDELLNYTGCCVTAGTGGLDKIAKSKLCGEALNRTASGWLRVRTLTLYTVSVVRFLGTSSDISIPDASWLTTEEARGGTTPFTAILYQNVWYLSRMDSQPTPMSTRAVSDDSMMACVSEDFN
jgi:hypothetical protein